MKKLGFHPMYVRSSLAIVLLELSLLFSQQLMSLAVIWSTILNLKQFLPCSGAMPNLQTQNWRESWTQFSLGARVRPSRLE